MATDLWLNMRLFFHFCRGLQPCILKLLKEILPSDEIEIRIWWLTITMSTSFVGCIFTLYIYPLNVNGFVHCNLLVVYNFPFNHFARLKFVYNHKNFIFIDLVLVLQNLKINNLTPKGPKCFLWQHSDFGEITMNRKKILWNFHTTFSQGVALRPNNFHNFWNMVKKLLYNMWFSAFGGHPGQQKIILWKSLLRKIKIWNWFFRFISM